MQSNQKKNPIKNYITEEGAETKRLADHSLAGPPAADPAGGETNGLGHSVH